MDAHTTQPDSISSSDSDAIAIDRMRNVAIGRMLGPTIALGSGTYFDFENPEAALLTIDDVAYGLGFTCRFAGQTVSQATGKRVFYAVAQHCVLMSHAVPPEYAYDALMHEVGEATCHDVNGPLKSLCPDYSRIEKRCQSAGMVRFNVPMTNPVLIKRYDMIMLATEQRDLMPRFSGHEWAKTAGIEPLKDVIVPWGPNEAAERFLARYEELKPTVGASLRPAALRP